jgi:transcriptional accessory protein Tex/SPT6
MDLSGVVRNVTDFGAFVDIGVGFDGLVSIIQFSCSYLNLAPERSSRKFLSTTNSKK